MPVRQEATGVSTLAARIQQQALRNVYYDA
jgi:hypothetical protein